MRSLPFILFATLCVACGGGEPHDGPDAHASDGRPVDAARLDTRDAAPLPAPVPDDEVLAPGPFGVGELLLELEDASRATPANGDYEGAATRALPTLVWYPTEPGPGDRLEPVEGAAPAIDGGPWPLVIYSHGFSSRHDDNAELAANLASRGFIVAAVDFPLTNIYAPGKPTVIDMPNQPGDVQFVLAHLLGDHPDADHPLIGLANAEKISLVGLSLGAMTSLAVTFHPDFQDPRIRAAVAIAPPGCYLTEDIYDTAAVPLLIIHGTNDAILTYPENGPPVWERANPPKYFLTLEGGTHTSMAGLAMPLMEVLGNTDDVGCQTMEGNPSIEAEVLAEMSAEFGGVDYATAMDQCPAPCTLEVPEGAMDPHRQLELVQRSTIAFLVARFQGDLRYEAYLRHAIVGDATDATMVFKDIDTQ